VLLLIRKIFIGICLFCLLFLIGYGKQLVISFKDGTKVVYNVDQIEEFYIEDGENLFSTIEGDWSGDKGIKNCFINESGVFSIQLNNGYAWSGYGKFENGNLILETPFPVPVEYMMNFDIPLHIAKQAIKIIERPDRWIFTISANGMVLEGQKRNFRLQWLNERILNVEYVVREAVWHRK